jgi:hypothetical protein
MRHLFGIILGIAMGAALFFGGGWGFHGLNVLALSTSPHLTSNTALVSLGALLATGLLLGVLMAVPQISPLATAVPGVAALAVTAMYVVSPSHTLRLIPLKHSNFGFGAHAMLVTGVYAALGIAMLVPLFVPSRWRRREISEDEEPISVAASSSYLS